LPGFGAFVRTGRSGDDDNFAFDDRSCQIVEEKVVLELDVPVPGWLDIDQSRSLWRSSNSRPDLCGLQKGQGAQKRIDLEDVQFYRRKQDSAQDSATAEME
jgi:hypothetical protein